MEFFLGQLKNKMLQGLDSQLKQALDSGKVSSIYEPSLPRQKDEYDEEFVNRVRKEALSFQFVEVSNDNKKEYIAFGVSGPIITDQGKLELIPAQIVGGVWGWHYILVYPSLDKVLASDEVFARLSSGCFSGGVLGDETCDCPEQLSLTKKLCIESGHGVIIEIPSQDGRGWSEYKMANQRLMDELDIDTVTAARMFYQDDKIIDQRSFGEAMLILKALGFSDKNIFNIGTKNPNKQKAFKDFGFEVASIEPVNVDFKNDIIKRNVEAKGKLWKRLIYLIFIFYVII